MAVINGTFFDDVLTGGAEDDAINASAGNDIVNAGGGADGVFGGGGNDQIAGEAGDDVLRGDGGNDFVSGGEGDDTIFGGTNEDVLTGGSGVNTLAGDAGDDRFISIFAENGTDTVDGGTGFDTVELVLSSADLSQAVIDDLFALNDYLTTRFSGVGQDANLLLTSTSTEAATFAEIGLTISNVEAVEVTLDGVTTELGAFLSSSDLVPSDPAPAAVVTPGDGVITSEISMRDGIDYDVTGTDASEEFTGSELNDYIVAGAGNDYVNGRSGENEIYGGAGNDRLFGGQQDDEIHGGADNDTVVGDFGNDVLYGDDGNDGLFGGGSNDTLFGGAGNDSLYGGNGDDILDGGTGINLLDGHVGDDTLIHTLGSTSTVIGSRGLDTLVLNLTSDGLSAEVVADLATLKAWMDDRLAGVGGDINVLAGQFGGAQLDLAALSLSLSDIERVIVTVDGEEVPLESVLNKAPVVTDLVAVTIDEDSTLSGNVDATDPDGDVLSYAVSQMATHGMVSVDASTGSYEYIPTADFAGEDRFTVVVTDIKGESVTQTIVVTVAPVADTANLSAQDVAAAFEAPAPLSGTRGRDVIYGDQAETLIDVELDISAMLTDTDGSETLELIVSGLPGDAVLSAGAVNADGTVSLTQAELEGLFVTVDGPQDFELTVTAITTDSDSVSETSAAFNVSVTADSLYDDVIDGLRGSDWISGGLGDDLINGGSGRDTIYGGVGNDVLSDGGGRDRVFGDDGDDTFLVGRGNDVYSGGSGFDIADFSGATRGVRVDLEAGSARGLGRDTLDSIEGVIGSDNRDRLTGDAADNMIDGGAGRDLIRGGAGEDLLTGGEGRDVFTWERSDMAVGTFDTITDFVVGEDLLDLTELSYVGRNAPDGEDRVQISEVNGGTLVSVDMSYLPGATSLVFLEGVTGLGGTDWFDI